jgi:hypothetical protein
MLSLIKVLYANKALLFLRQLPHSVMLYSNLPERQERVIGGAWVRGITPRSCCEALNICIRMYYRVFSCYGIFGTNIWSRMVMRCNYAILGLEP